MTLEVNNFQSYLDAESISATVMKIYYVVVYGQIHYAS